MQKTEQQFSDGAQNRHTKYKNWSWQNTKQTWTLVNTKPEHNGAQNRHEHYWKTEKLNSTSTAQYKTDMNLTGKLSSTFTMEH